MTAAPRVGWLAVRDDRPAVIEPGRGRVSYAELDRLADRVAARLRRLGVEPGARVGIYTRRSCDAIAAMLGTLRAGGTYVPVDPAAPAARNAEIHVDCGVAVTLVERDFEPAYRAAADQLGGAIDVQGLCPVGLGRAIDAWAELGGAAAPQDEAPASEIACLLYTSGSTGRHKGWMMSRAAIEAFVGWSHRLLGSSDRDVYANHAPFSFAMSVHDIYASLACGASLVLVPEEVRLLADQVVDLLARERVTIWFSAPAILSRMAAVNDAEARDLGALRAVMFAGEVFPAPSLAALRRRMPHPRYLHCWGSTETNIGVYKELPAGVELDGPPPIGRPCAHYEARVVGADGHLAPEGVAGELQLRGVGLDTGYVNQPELTAERMVQASDGGAPWYRTCDLVIQLPDGDLRYAGRIGRMVKLRGYRVEPGEIETRLQQHPLIKEVGVVPVEGPRGLSLVAHVSGTRVPIVELKEFCAAKLPPYMVPERFVFHGALPRTSRGKIDYASLVEAP